MGMHENLKELLEIEKENNHLLKKLWRNVKITRATKFLYWTVIIAMTLGAYYYIQPFIDGLVEVYSGLGDAASGLKNLPDVNLLNKLFGR